MLSFTNASSHVVGDTLGDLLGLALGLADGLVLGLTDGDRLGLALGLAVGATHPRHVTMQLTRTYALTPHCCRDSRSWHSDVDR